MKEFNKYELDVESVIGIDALYESMMKCRRGVLWKDSVASFYLRGVERSYRLCKELHDKTYKPSPPKHFNINYPKPRQIASVSFRDRVYQRSLNDNVVYPLMTKSFIYDNFACQKGKGTDAARNRLKEFLRRHYRKHECDGYVAQFDIKGYYPNMPHEVAEETFKKQLPDWAFERVKEILQTQYDGDKGYNPGSQLVQIAGISVLNSLDHYIKEQLHAKLYIRYMDDFLIIHEDKEYLEYCSKEIKHYLKRIGLDTNPKKTKIYPLSNGIQFLGFDFKLSKTGKVIMLIDSRNVKAQRKKLRRLVNKCLNGEIDKDRVDDSYSTWKSHASKGNSFHLLQRMDKYYRSLWKLKEVDSFENYSKGF